MDPVVILEPTILATWFACFALLQCTLCDPIIFVAGTPVFALPLTWGSLALATLLAMLP